MAQKVIMPWVWLNRVFRKVRHVQKTREPAMLTPTLGRAEGITEMRRQEALLKAGALRNAIFNISSFSSIAVEISADRQKGTDTQ